MSRLQHKRGRKSNYSLSLNTIYWKEVRQIVIARDRKCSCGSILFLEVHHKTYFVNGVNIVGKEKEYLEYLELLCSKCHSKKHKYGSKKTKRKTL